MANLKNYKLRMTEIVNRVTRECGIPMTPVAQREFIKIISAELDSLSNELSKEEPEKTKRVLVTTCNRCGQKITLDFQQNVWAEEVT